MSYASEYKRIRKNLMQQVRSLRQKGYEVDVQIPKIPKRITAGSVRRIKKIKQKIPKIVTYQGKHGYGAFRERRSELKRQRDLEKKLDQFADKYKEPQDFKQAEWEPEPEPETEPEEEIETEPESQTEPETKPEPEELEPETEEEQPYKWRDQGGEDAWDEKEDNWEDVSAGEIVYKNLLDLIDRGWSSAGEYADRADKYPANSQMSKDLRKKADEIAEGTSLVAEQLDKAIAENGFDEVMKNLAATSPEVLGEAQDIIYYKPATDHEKATHEWLSLLKFGELLSEAEARAVDPRAFPDEGENDSYNSPFKYF